MRLFQSCFNSTNGIREACLWLSVWGMEGRAGHPISLSESECDVTLKFCFCSPFLSIPPLSLSGFVAAKPQDTPLHAMHNIVDVINLHLRGSLEALSQVEVDHLYDIMPCVLGGILGFGCSHRASCCRLRAMSASVASSLRRNSWSVWL